MKIIRKTETKQFKNSDVCIATDYWTGDKDINGELIEVSGRYPAKGRVVNLKCKEMAYIIRGFGRAVVEGEEVKFSEGDCVFIEAGEKYFWDGAFTIFSSSTPAWYHEQHKEVE